MLILCRGTIPAPTDADSLRLRDGRTRRLGSGILHAHMHTNIYIQKRRSRICVLVVRCGGHVDADVSKRVSMYVCVCVVYIFIVPAHVTCSGSCSGTSSSPRL